jgi:tetratricopeptide (TPR) repeat protein
MSIDIYSPCPCGSGKKLKFCCQAIAEEMDRAIRLVEGNQPRVALQQLDQLAKKHPLNVWIDTTRGMLLLDLNEGATARDILRAVLEEHPDNELAIVLYAAAMVQAEGFDHAKRALHRAFQKSAKKLPALVGDLASSLASVHASRGQMMAAREHLALALRLAPEERRQALFVQLLELDGADEIPYVLRGSHQLPTITGSDELQMEVRKGQKYAAVGCWSIAADVFLALANNTPECAELWHSTGLCRAWDGDEKNAAEALHRAARIYSDPGIAVECETLAQILDEKTTSNVVEQCVYQANIQSVSRLLTVLDAQSRMARLKLPSEESDENVAVASYLILDVDAKGNDEVPLTLANIPRVQGQVSIFDADPKSNQSAFLMLAGFRGERLDSAKTLLTSASGDLIEWRADLPQPQISGTVPAESLIFEMNWYLSDRIPLVRRRDLFEQFWLEIANEKWPNQPLSALGGKTPWQAASDESLKIPLLGALYALDAAAQRRERGIGLKKLFERFGVPPLPPLVVTHGTNLGSLSIMQLHRLSPDSLTDHQLVTVVNRSMLIRHDETLYDVLKAAVARKECAAQFDLSRIYRALCDICTTAGRREEALSWLDQARHLPVPEGKTAFQNSWAWDMVELGTRLEDPADPELKVLLSRFVNYYAPKVPQIRPHIEQMLQGYGVPSPWESLDLVIPGSISAASPIWDPNAAEPVPAGGSKLWLPGQ